MLKNTLKSYASHIFQAFQDFQQMFSTVDIHQRCWSSRLIKKKVRSGGDEGSLGSLCLATVGLLPRAKTALSLMIALNPWIIHIHLKVRSNRIMSLCQQFIHTAAAWCLIKMALCIEKKKKKKRFKRSQPATCLDINTWWLDSLWLDGGS